MSYLFQCYANMYDRFLKCFHLDDDKQILEIIGNGNKKIADIGGGTGRTADLLIRCGHSVTIIDPSKSMTKLAIKRNGRIRIINQSMPGELDEEYDIFLLRDCLHHVKNQKELLYRCSERLRDKGEIIIADFSPKSMKTKGLFLFERLCFEKIYPVEEDILLEQLKALKLNTECIPINERDYIVRGWRQE